MTPLLPPPVLLLPLPQCEQEDPMKTYLKQKYPVNYDITKKNWTVTGKINTKRRRQQGIKDVAHYL
eukprot:2657753-Ditylum_brightwellii.AAC.1